MYYEVIPCKLFRQDCGVLTYSAPKDPVNRVIDGINGVVDKTPDLFSKIMGIFNGGFTADNVDISDIEATEAEFTEEPEIIE